MRLLRRGTQACGILFCGGALAGATTAAASSELGQVSTATSYDTGACFGNNTWLQDSTAAPPNYVVPAGGGVITSWREKFGHTGAQVKLKVFRRTANSSVFDTVGSSAAETLNGEGEQSFPTRIPVEGGDLLGRANVSGDATACFSTSSADDKIRLGTSAADPSPGTPLTTTTPSGALRINVAATLEPDADDDGFGDETQDLCPTTPGSCAGGTDLAPPTVAMSSKSSRLSAGGFISFLLTASEDSSGEVTASVNVASSSRVLRFRPKAVTLAANVPTRVRIRLSRRNAAKARRALRRGRRLTARLTITLKDAAGNEAITKARVRLRR